MNLNYIKTFFYTVKLGSLTNAAAFLEITQPAATRQIQELQSRFDTVLFDKSGKKMILTDVGKIVYGIAEKIIDLEKEIDRSVKDYKNQKIGNIKILTNESFGNYYLSEIIYLFSRMSPEISILVDFQDKDLIIDEMLSMKYDIAFTNEAISHESLEITKIINEHFFLIMKPDYALSDLLYFSPEDIRGQSFVALNSSSTDRMLIDNYFLQNRLDISVKYEVSSYYSLKNMVKNRLGISIIPKNIANEDITAGNLVAIPEKNRSIFNTFYMIKHKDKFFNKSLAVFSEITLKWSDFYSKGLLDSSHWEVSDF